MATTAPRRGIRLTAYEAILTQGVLGLARSRLRPATKDQREKVAWRVRENLRYLEGEIRVKVVVVPFAPM